MTERQVADAHRPRQHGAGQPAGDVAVGILFDAQGRFLMTSRPTGKAYAGYWEFPGGKFEAGESLEQALCRELREELGVDVRVWNFWRATLVDYPHALVRLHFCRVTAWEGALQMHDGQQAAWQTLPVQVQPVLPGTLPVLEWLKQEQAC